MPLSPNPHAQQVVRYRGDSLSNWLLLKSVNSKTPPTVEIEHNRANQAKAWMWSEITDELVDDLKSDPDVKARVKQLEKKVTDGKLSPTVAAQQLIATFLKRSD